MEMPYRLKKPVKAYSKHYHLGLGFHGFHRINYLESREEELDEIQEKIESLQARLKSLKD